MTKTKKLATVNDNDENAVLQYLRKTNRPYNATDVHTNLNGILTKSSVIKALDKLTEKQLAFSKTYGKSVIYSIVQEDEEDISAEDMTRLDSHIERLTQQFTSLREVNNEKMNELKKLSSTLPTADAQAQLLQLKAQNEESSNRLIELQSDKQQITSETKERIEKEYDTNIKLWRSRKKLFNEIFKTVTEHIPGKLSDFKEELGIEEDPVPIESVLVD